MLICKTDGPGVTQGDQSSHIRICGVEILQLAVLHHPPFPALIGYHVERLRQPPPAEAAHYIFRWVITKVTTPYGGGAWESNPPTDALAPILRF